MLDPIKRAWREWQRRAGAARSTRERSAMLRAKGFRAEDALIVTGDPRGGTTWLAETLCAWPGTAMNWEPLHHQLGMVPEAMHWGRRPFIPESDTDPERIALMRDLLSGKRTNEWTLRYCSTEHAVGAERLLTKFVRANLLLPWMTARITFARKPILLLRHPVPTVLSQLKAFPNAEHRAAAFRVPDQLFNERFIAHADYLSSLPPGLERSLALWCLNNQATLRHPRHGSDWLVVHYEDLLHDPITSLERIGEAWRVDPAPWIDHVRINRSSATDFHQERLSDPSAQATKWMQRIDASQAVRLQSILDHFGIQEYRVESATPSGAHPG
ncbi:MAG TPA: sulfotransferase [Flavobacteriales bacterium]|nr:sulfotransferase [Flavobacteriales bacterium]